MDIEEKSLIDEEEEYLGDFIRSADKIVRALRSDLELFRVDTGNGEIINSLFRGFHNLKSSAFSLRLPNIRRIAHSVEDLLEMLRDKKAAVNEDILGLICQSIENIDEVLISLYETGIEGKSRVSFIIELREYIKQLKNPAEKKD